MLKTITTAAAVALLAAGSALAAPVTDCKVLAGKALSQEAGAKAVERVVLVPDAAIRAASALSPGFAVRCRSLSSIR